MKIFNWKRIGQCLLAFIIIVLLGCGLEYVVIQLGGSSALGHTISTSATFVAYGAVFLIFLKD